MGEGGMGKKKSFFGSSEDNNAPDSAPQAPESAPEDHAGSDAVLGAALPEPAPAPILAFELCRFNKRNASPAGRAHKCADLLRGFGFAVTFADPDESGEVAVTVSR